MRKLVVLIPPTYGYSQMRRGKNGNNKIQEWAHEIMMTDINHANPGSRQCGRTRRNRGKKMSAWRSGAEAEGARRREKGGGTEGAREEG